MRDHGYAREDHVAQWSLDLLESGERRDSPRLELLGEILELLERYEDAEAIYQTWVKRAPNLPKPQERRANNLVYGLRDYPRAEATLRDALERFPDHFDLICLQALVIGYFQDRHGDAARLYERALEIDDEDAGTWANNAYVLACSGAIQQAIAAATRALEMAGPEPDEDESGPCIEAAFTSTP